ncbi:uncharacterized protein, partial [Malus domestica]|uniref:uncharacterized protein n=1 Tax=Malus domestica TaxID=3750 RepID=UPI0039765905
GSGGAIKRRELWGGDGRSGASIALLPCGSLSGHFIHRQDASNVCFGLPGTELACEKECSRGKDYRLIKLAIIDYNRKKERVVVVECRGHDAARLQSIDHAHGWEEDVVDLVEEQHGKNKVLVSFNCETIGAKFPTGRNTSIDLLTAILTFAESIVRGVSEESFSVACLGGVPTRDTPMLKSID